MDESEKSSTWRELAAIKFLIEAFGTWHTDSQNAVAWLVFVRFVVMFVCLLIYLLLFASLFLLFVYFSLRCF